MLKPAATVIITLAVSSLSYDELCLELLDELHSNDWPLRMADTGEITFRNSYFVCYRPVRSVTHWVGPTQS